MVNNREAGIRRLCMICGTPGALLIRLVDDGRNVRACEDCLSRDEYWTRYEIREPLPIERKDA